MPTSKTPVLSFRSRKFWLLLAIVLAVVLVLFLTFRPVGEQSVVKDDAKPVVYEPVVYDTSDWQLAGQTIDDLDKLKTQIGSAASREEGLDFYGRPASIYRYSAKHEPPLYVVESSGLVELVWYYAAATDDQATKDKSLEFAKRAYLMMSAAGGQKAATLVHQILQGVPMMPQPVGRFELIKADCQDYRCQIVLKGD